MGHGRPPPAGDDAPRAQLLASGVGVPWALEAQELLKNDWGVVADVWSVTSWNELRRDALDCDEHNFLHPDEEPLVPFVVKQLQGRPGPFIATSDHMRLQQDQIAQWVPGEYHSLGADGFRSEGGCGRILGRREDWKFSRIASSPTA